MSVGVAKKPLLRTMPQTDFILFGTLTVLLAVLAAALPHGDGAVSVDDVKLGDVMTISIGISGIVIPLIIAYLSLGRTSDVFSEIGDAVPFFLEREGLAPAVLANAILNERGQRLVELRALDEIRCLRAASGRHLLQESKALFIPAEQEAAYSNYLANNADRIMALNYVFIIGLAAGTCLLLLYGVHYDSAWTAGRVTAHGFAVATIGFNICGAKYFLELSKIREKVQASVEEGIKALCSKLKKEKLDKRMDDADLSGDATANKLLAKKLEIESAP
jgi:hypothetical protein